VIEEEVIMNTGVICCLIMGGLFLVLAAVFALMKEKGAVLISGFNSLPRQEREQYDCVRMSKDMRNSLLIWTAVFAAGALLCYCVSPYIAIVAFVVWGILFFKDVHFDSDKAFGKYRKSER
jgi:hypothetical protein